MSGTLKSEQTRRRGHAKQFSGVPDHHSALLFPVLGDGVQWSVGTDGIVEGFTVPDGSTVGFCPIPVPEMKMDRFVVAVGYEAIGGSVPFALRLNYRARNGTPQGENAVLHSVPLMCGEGKFGLCSFPILPERLMQMFLASLTVIAPDGEPAPDRGKLIFNVWVRIFD